MHVRCHIGTDTLSLARLGAAMTGADFSPASLEQARRLAAAAGPAVTYVHGDVYDASAALGVTYDLVHTALGALCLLPESNAGRSPLRSCWAGRPTFPREAHPVLWALCSPVERGGVHLARRRAQRACRWLQTRRDGYG